MKRWLTSLLVALGILVVAQAAPLEGNTLVFAPRSVHTEIINDARCTAASGELADKDAVGVWMDGNANNIGTTKDRMSVRVSSAKAHKTTDGDPFLYRFYQCETIGTGERRDAFRPAATDHIRGRDDGSSVWTWDKI